MFVTRIDTSSIPAMGSIFKLIEVRGSFPAYGKSLKATRSNGGVSLPMGSLFKLLEVRGGFPAYGKYLQATRSNGGGFPYLWEVSSRSFKDYHNVLMGVVYYGVHSAPTTLVVAEL